MSTRLTRLHLRAVVFTAGFAVMGVEMSASRLLAPYFGTSLYVWAVLIGLIMIYLAVGYYLGGRLADRRPSADVLYRLCAVAGFCIGLVPLLAAPILRWSAVGFAELSAGIFLGSLCGVLVLFSLPLVLLGCVSPFAVRLDIESLNRAGNTAGAMYAISTVGSLAGTFVTVFALIPTVGTRRSLLALSLVLMSMALLGLWKRRPLYLALLVPAVVELVLAPAGVRTAEVGRLLYERESAYYYIQVVRQGARRELILDEGHAVHSVYDPHRLLTGAYWDDFLLAPLFAPRYRPKSVRRVAILGLGGGTAARLYSAEYPRARLDGVEIDPAVVAAASRYLGMDEPRLHVYTEDGRYFLLTRRNAYDVILVDAFRQPYIPFQMTTREFFEAVRRHLTPRGVVAINCGHTATDFRLVDAVAATMGAVFPHVTIVDVPGTINSLVFASAQRVDAATLRRRLPAAPPLTRTVARTALEHGNLRPAPRSGTVFTDDLAPVEQLIDQIVLDYVKSS